MKDSKYPTKEIYFDAMVNTAATYNNLIIMDSKTRTTLIPYIVKLVLTTILSLFLRGI